MARLKPLTVLVHPGPVPVAPLLQHLRGHLHEQLEATLAYADIDVRVWPHVGNSNDIRYALVSRIPPGLLQHFPELQLVGSLHAGVDHLLRDPAFPSGVTLTRPVPAGGDVLMNEYILAQVLSHHRNLPAYSRAQAERRWERSGIVAASDRPVGLLGLGAMAGPAAALLLQVGFDVAAWVRLPRPPMAMPVFHGEAGLDALLQRSQILVNMLPLTAATENIIDARMLRRLPRGAVLINVGRGEHVVEADLLSALRSGQLSGATLDVFRQEPLPPEDPLWSHPGICITPHACRQVDIGAVVAQFAVEVGRSERGEPPLHGVDMAAGY